MTRAGLTPAAALRAATAKAARLPRVGRSTNMFAPWRFVMCLDATA